MGRFLHKIKTVDSKYLFGVGLLFVLVCTALFYFNAEAASTPIPVDLETGDVYGYAWMGTEITTAGVSEGGGGWLNLNCKTTDCTDGNGNGSIDSNEIWGVTIDMDHSGTDGAFSGEAWSSNYGWLVFRGAGLPNCWSDNPGVTSNSPAMADMSVGTGVVDVTGWGKFVAGNDDATDGWDGCVSFSGPNHSVKLDMDTGNLIGWAWGGPVVGWISFQNPECPFCNTAVALPNVPQMTFWANPATLSPGLTNSTLNWTSTNVNGNYIESCQTYDNTSGYSHWDSSLPNTLPNVAGIGVISGNLPNGTHPASGITQTTTYSLKCQDKFGEILPTKYATVTVLTAGCTDPTASNYDPDADIDDGSCGDPLVPSISLNVITNETPNDTLPEGSSNPVDYQVSPRWVFTNRNMFASGYCTQSFTDENGTTQILNAWTGAQLSNPTLNGNNPFDPSGNSWVTTTNISMFADDAPVNSVFTFTITCLDLNGTPVSASDTVRIVAVPPPLSPTLVLFAENPTLIIGSGNYSEKLWWTSNDPSNLSSCEGDFVRTSPTAQNPNLANWETDSLPSIMNATPGYTAHQTSFTTIANGVTVDGTTYRFTITCDDDLNPGETVSASTNVQFIYEPIPCCEPPFLDLIIKLPNSDNDLHTEQIPAAGWDNSVELEPFTLKWSAQNVQNCTARSEQFNAGPGGSVSANGNWDGQSIPDDGDPFDLSQVEKEFSIPAPLDTKNTIFYLDCYPDDPGFGTAVMTAQVCMSITGQLPFPQCTVTGAARVPAYIEI